MPALQNQSHQVEPPGSQTWSPAPLGRPLLPSSVAESEAELDLNPLDDPFLDEGDGSPEERRAGIAKMVNRLLYPFVPSYVRRRAILPESWNGVWEKVQERLRMGEAFVEEQFMTVVIVDVSGYSKLTSDLSELGKLASEVITESLGRYLGKIVSVAEQFDGNVVKFLGDALLVCFHSLHPLPAAGAPEESLEIEKEKEQIVLKAILFTLTVMETYPSAVICMNPFTAPGELLSGHASNISSHVPETRELRLHSAVWCGMARHVIAGIVTQRLDYFVMGDFADDLGRGLTEAKSDEVGISYTVATILERCTGKKKEEGRITKLKNPEFASLIARISERMKLPPPPQVPPPPSIPNTITLPAQRGRRSVELARAPSILKRFPPSAPAETELPQYMDNLRLFVNEAMVLKLNPIAAARLRSARSALAARDAGKLQRGATYVPLKASDVGDFRTVACVFVKLLAEPSTRKMQDIISAFISSVSRFHGVYLQLAVDDKGNSLMAGFGLPPFSTETNALNAVLGVMSFAEEMVKRQLGAFRAGISAGDILFTKIGNDFRSEPSILGDSICIAARLMAITTSPNVIIFDKSIAPFIPSRFRYKTLGLTSIKGKAEMIELFEIPYSSFADSLSPRDKNLPDVEEYNLCGYLQERKSIAEHIESWATDSDGDPPSKCLVTIKGQSGAGKTRILEFGAAIAQKHGAQVCLTFGSELRQVSALEKVDKLTEILNFSPGLHLTIAGLEEESVKQLLLHGLMSFGVTSISSDVVRAVYERSLGIPLKASMMVETILQAGDEIFQVIDGKLLAVGSPDEIDKMFSNSVGADIIAQFDRLNSAFQDLLKKASIFGQYFTIDQITGICETSSKDPERLEELIAVSDKNTIYESIPFYERKRLHGMAASYFMSVQESYQRHLILPAICFHSIRGEEAEKTYPLLEELASILIDRHLYESANEVRLPAPDLCHNKKMHEPMRN
ncbi:hypothetical protein HDU96_005445 [Phlyctochytrium bullatum]|nr:hypothetical protein HDU96_005445 [Phlyctochytrium bullatum]